MFPSRVLELLHLSSATGSYRSTSGQRLQRVLGKRCWYVIRLVDKEWTHQLFGSTDTHVDGIAVSQGSFESIGPRSLLTRPVHDRTSMPVADQQVR